MNINPHIFRAYDIRGIAMGSALDLTPATMKLIGQGAGTYLKRTYGTKNMLVGRDNRLHSEELQKAFIEGVLSTGMDVTDIGLATSPLLYYGVCRFGMDSGVNITASHNPKEYNGVKIVREGAHSVCGDELQKILELIQSGDFETAAGAGSEAEQGGFSSRDDIFKTYRQDIAGRIKLVRPLKVVVDAGNGTAGKFAPDLLRALGCDVTELYCNLDGNYPNHEANPEEAENMRELGELVRAGKADLGIGFDGDGDRVGIVDENGKHYSADYLIILLARDLLKHKPGSQIVFDVKVSKILIDDIEKNGGVPVMCKTGHSFIETKMHELGAPLAGEISGHLFFGKDHYDYYGFDDAFFGACKILQILSQSEGPKGHATGPQRPEGSSIGPPKGSGRGVDKKFSQHFTDLPAMYTTPEYKTPCPDDKKFEIVKQLADHFTRQHQCITIDGVRVNFDDTSWGAVRCSNTSPNLTLRFEALTKERLTEIQKLMAEQLKKYPEVDVWWHRP